MKTRSRDGGPGRLRPEPTAVSHQAGPREAGEDADPGGETSRGPSVTRTRPATTLRGVAGSTPGLDALSGAVVTGGPPQRRGPNGLGATLSRGTPRRGGSNPSSHGIGHPRRSGEKVPPALSAAHLTATTGGGETRSPVHQQRRPVNRSSLSEQATNERPGSPRRGRSLSGGRQATPTSQAREWRMARSLSEAPAGPPNRRQKNQVPTSWKTTQAE